MHTIIEQASSRLMLEIVDAEGLIQDARDVLPLPIFEAVDGQNIASYKGESIVTYIELAQLANLDILNYSEVI